MKILVSPPRNKQLFYHEAQTARKARYIISGLQLLSGTTALIGIRLYFSDWLNDLNPVMQYVVMGLIAFVLVAPGEMGIRETWAYLFRALLNRYNKGLNLFSLVLMGIVAIFLTSYSFYLSQNATRSSMQRAAPKVVLADTKAVSTSFNEELKRISRDYATQRDDINKRYNDLILAENDYYDNLIQVNEVEIDQLRRKGWSTGTRYTTKINSLEKKNRELETRRAESIKGLKEKQNAELTAAATWKRSAETEAQEEKQASRDDIQSRNQEIVDENRAFAQMFSTLIARFAAWSVILVILFTGYLEIFYYKTGIKRVVQFRSTDFQAPVFLELLVFPYVYFSRHLTNFVRSRYDKLPRLVPAPGTEDLGDLAAAVAEDTLDDEAELTQEERLYDTTGTTNRSDSSVADHAVEMDAEPNPAVVADESPVTPENKEAAPAQKQSRSYQEPELFANNDYPFEHRQKDQAPQGQSDAASLSDSLSAIFKGKNEQVAEPTDRVNLDLSFDQEVDYAASLKHVDRRTGQVQYLSMDDLEEKIDGLSGRMDEASEMYQDTGDPIYLATIEECRNAMAYWQNRRVELHQKMFQSSGF